MAAFRLSIMAKFKSNEPQIQETVEEVNLSEIKPLELDATVEDAKQ